MDDSDNFAPHRNWNLWKWCRCAAFGLLVVGAAALVVHQRHTMLTAAALRAAGCSVDVEPWDGGNIAYYVGCNVSEIPGEIRRIRVGSNPSPTWVSLIEDCTSLNQLDAWEYPLEDEDLVRWRSLHRLEYFTSTSPRLTERGIRHLAALPRLCWLTIGGPELGDEALAALRGHATIERLELQEGHLTDEGLKVLCTLPNLVDLNIAGAAEELTIPGSYVLLNCPRLRFLSCGFSSDDPDFAEYQRRFLARGVSAD